MTASGFHLVLRRADGAVTVLTPNRPQRLDAELEGRLSSCTTRRSRIPDRCRR